MPVIPKVTPEKVQAIRARYMAPDMPTLKSIAREFGVQPETVEKACAGLPFRQPERQMSAKKVRELWAAGVFPPREVAKRLGVSVRFVLRVLRPPPETPEERDARKKAVALRRKAKDAGLDEARKDAHELVAAGYTEAHIVEELGLSDEERSALRDVFAERDL